MDFRRGKPALHSGVWVIFWPAFSVFYFSALTTLTERLHDSGAEFRRVSSEPISPIWSFLLTFILPMLIFIGLGQKKKKKLMEQAGGKNALSFGMEKSNAKVYVQSSKGIRFADVAGEDEANTTPACC